MEPDALLMDLRGYKLQRLTIEEQSKSKQVLAKIFHLSAKQIIFRSIYLNSIFFLTLHFTRESENICGVEDLKFTPTSLLRFY